MTFKQFPVSDFHTIIEYSTWSKNAFITFEIFRECTYSIASSIMLKNMQVLYFTFHSLLFNNGRDRNYIIKGTQNAIRRNLEFRKEDLTVLCSISDE